MMLYITQVNFNKAVTVPIIMYYSTLTRSYFNKHNKHCKKTQVPFYIVSYRSALNGKYSELSLNCSSTYHILSRRVPQAVHCCGAACL